MSDREVIETILNKHSNLNKLQIALFVVRNRINHCLKYNLDMSKDSILSKILLFK